MTVFVRLIDATDKGKILKLLIEGLPVSQGVRRFVVDPQAFRKIPRAPFAYWVSDAVRQLFTSLPALEQTDRNIRVGLATTSDPMFVRLWSEVAPEHIKSSDWLPYAKGGSFSRYFQDVHLVVHWADGGRLIKARVRQMGDAPSRYVASEERYLQQGLTYPRRTQGGFNVREMPQGCIFANKGPSIFVHEGGELELLMLLALMNSAPFRLLLSLQMAFGSYEVGVVQRTPTPRMTMADQSIVGDLARRAWSAKSRLDMRVEASHKFTLPALLQVEGEKIAERGLAWAELVHAAVCNLLEVQADIDERCFGLYGINDDDRRAITEGFAASTEGSEAAEVGTAEDDAEDDDETEADSGADTAELVAELVSWAVGVAFGRFDVRLATGERPLPLEPEPFKPLPVCSPGMLTGEDRLPLASPPAGYPLSFPEDGILVDDPGHSRDLAAGVRVVFEAVFGSRADARWQEAEAVLDPRDHDLRHWLTSEFFDHHLRRYSKSRRKAPIIWQLGIPSGRYSVWCYAHRMTRDSLLTIQNDVVGPKLATEERRLSSLVTQGGETPSARERAEIATQGSLVDELRTLLDDVRRVAPLWNPDLDDGIVLVLAPLWRLVPTHKAWHKELRTKWDELVAGKYDWAHVAMHLWPERVVPKCAADRSLAIAHGLEDVFWVEGTDDKWSRITKPARPIADLVAERTSAAVKAALTALLDAQQPLGAAKRRGRTSREAS